jgi:hypothetical protein
MANGMSPTDACEESAARITKVYPFNCGLYYCFFLLTLHIYPDFVGALICLNKKGDFGAAKGGSLASFPFVVRNGDMKTEEIIVV